jgi:hypothetical protein
MGVRIFTPLWDWARGTGGRLVESMRNQTEKEMPQVAGFSGADAQARKPREDELDLEGQ